LTRDRELAIREQVGRMGFVVCVRDHKAPDRRFEIQPLAVALG
jgi:hypothetical protein